VGKHLRRNHEPRRGDTTLAKNVIEVIFHAMLSKERAKFVLKTRLLVVRLLVLDLSNYLIEVRRTNAERTISLILAGSK
jgi:hypothetical protein